VYFDEDFASSCSGSPIAYGVLESAYSNDLTNENAKQIASKAVAAAMERDPGTGNGIDVLVIPNMILVNEEYKGVNH
jgi:proteasome beta subunit